MTASSQMEVGEEVEAIESGRMQKADRVAHPEHIHDDRVALSDTL